MTGGTVDFDHPLPTFESGYSVDVDDLLFTPERDFLVKNNDEQVKAVDLKGKTIVFVICPLYGEEDYWMYWDDDYRNPWSMLDLVHAYQELTPLRGIEFDGVKFDFEFVFAPVYLTRKPFYLSLTNNHVLPNPHSASKASKRSIYDKFISTMPWPALPFDDVEHCGSRVAKAFSVRNPPLIPYWVIVGPDSKVVATKSIYPYLFKLFGGAELYPLSQQFISNLWYDYDPLTTCGRSGVRYRCEARKRFISKWDQHLASPTRDFLLSSNGEEVPISSLHDKVIGLYFCENIPDPPSMEVIKRVYGDAKSLGYKFEIVQINFHYQFFNAIYTETADLDKEVVYEDVNWLRLPFKDPSCRKLQRMFECKFDDENDDWHGDCLVIIDPRKAGSTTEVLFEFTGAEILKAYGIKGYPFTKPSLFNIERKWQREELTLQSLFSQECRFAKDGRDWCNVYHLMRRRKRVLVLFGECGECKDSKFVSMLKSKYVEQLNGGAEENEFEVVYVSLDYQPSFSDYIRAMPWLVCVFPLGFGFGMNRKVFKYMETQVGAAAFDMGGRLIAKERFLDFGLGQNEPFKFPFVAKDWDGLIKYEVGAICEFGKYSYHIEH